MRETNTEEEERDANPPQTMQGIHHQQQQLATLLSVALPKDDSSSSTSAAVAAAPSEQDDSSRLAALESLHRAILYPPNSFLVTHSASFLAQGFSQLLSDKSYAVRQSAARAFGALCSVVSSISAASNGRQNHVMLSSLVDRFFSWALPLLSHVNAGDKTTELALGGLHEFLNVGDAGAIERYASPILKASQELLEDERTSWSLLHQLLGVLTLLSSKFSRCFQPHFADVVDLLLGWALVPDLAESDRSVIMDSFLQFQKHWVSNMSFSLGLVSKFLGDMDVLLQDASPGTPKQFRRLLALLSCFLTVLQSTASGLLEMNLLEQISEPLSQMLPRLLACLSMVGKKFGWSKWIGDSWRCFTLLAEILREGFCSFYPFTLDILFQSLEMDNTTRPFAAGKINSFQVHGVLKTNLQLLSLQKLGLPPLSVQKILQFDKPISQLRLHPNHLVTGSSAATYIFLLQHGNNEIVEQATTSIIEEIKLLIGMLGKLSGHNDGVSSILDSKAYSKLEVFALIKFDLTVLLSCVSLGGNKSLIGQPDVAALYLKRSKILAALIIDRLNPFDLPVQGCVELQVNIIKTLGKLSAVEFLSKCSIRKQSSQEPSVSVASDELLGEKNFRDGDSYMIIEHLSKCSIFVVKALHLSSPVEVKVQALEWIQSFCEDVISLYDNSDGIINPCSCNACGHVVIVGNLVRAVLDASSDREPKLRAHSAVVLELLLRARLVHPVFLYSITEVVLEKLGDPQMDIRNAFVRLLSVVLPITMHQQGLVDDGAVTAHRTGVLWLRNRSYLHWKQVFALKQLPQQLQSQQLVSILSYISQRWKVPLSSWIYRLIQRCRRSTGFPFSEREETGNFSANGSWLNMRIDDDILDKISSVNNLAGAWWAIHEAARYCIATRLRTNLGGPTQTFAALERMLLDTAHLLQLETEQKDGNLNLISPSSAHLLPMRLLLDFVEALKKNVYNAYDGSTVLLSANRQSSLFFRANKKVCEEWFSRICEPMMNAGLALQCHDGVIHYCALRLQELKNLVASALKDRSRTQMSENPQNIRGKFSEDILRVLRHMALAHCKSHDPDALVGLQKWVSKTFSALLGDENQSSGPNEILRPFSWMTGLVYQAQGQYEKAAAHFTHMLQDEESLMGSDFVQFAIARVIESYTAVSDWKSLESWLLELQTLRAKHAGRTYSGALTTAGIEINAIQALAHFDEHDYQAAWACLDLTPKSSCELTLDPKLALQRSEQMLLQAMLFQSEGKVDKVSHEIQKAKSMLEEMLSVLPLDGLREAAAYATQLHCIFAFEEGYSFRCSEEKQKQHHSILSTSIQAVQSSIDNVHQDCSLWLKIFRVYQNMLPSSPVTLKLAKNLSTLARKQGNLGLANRLNDYLGNNVLSCYEGSFRDNLTSNLQYEGILLMHAENNIEDAITSLWNFVHPCIVSSASIVSDVDESILKAKACLKLSKWLRQDLFYTIISENIALKMLADCSITDDASLSRGRMAFTDGNICEKPNVELIVEEIVGTTTKLSTHLCPTMGKAWISYASWCYSQARDSLSSSHENVLRSCSFSSTLVPEILPERFKLSEDEIQRVESVILRLFQRRRDAVNENHEREEQGFWIESVRHLRDEDPVKPMVEQVVNIIEDSAGAAGGENSTGECLSATFTSRLHIFFVNAIVGLREKEVSLLIDDLVDVWWPLRRRRVSLFGHAAYGFIQYLSYSSSKILDAGLVGRDCEPLKQKSGSHTLRATLYVLHILLNFGVELKDTIEPALLTIPLFPWQEVTPQLFARLTSHPEKGVRKELEGILILLAKLSPWSIVYPTLVDVNACEEESYEELQHILGCLSKLYPRLIEDVQLMISELENVTVLWEELWLSTLQDLHTDVMRRINVLKEEAARIAENDTLSHNEKNKINAAKYSAMMAPVFVALERRLASTSRKPETRHEIWFNREYAEQLKSAILTFKVPPATIAALGDVWRPFDNIASSLTNHQRKSSISLEEVAPRLALLSSSDVPMPGLEKQMAMSESDGGLEHNALGGIVRIASFSEQVSILSTKTKPKKLVILGSDGERYTYLLKGREDLRLDARIMQLLQAINGFLHSSPGTRNQCLGIRYYSVTPISGRAGLIQWVDNVISIYSVFKSWQNRAQLAVLGAGSSKNTVPLHVPRPSDMFYGKIIPALKEKGIRRVISRRDWPHEVKRKVLQDLMKEAPRQLLHQELWCASEGFKAFSSKLKRYSGSVAAMSMVGHILGLGDRHLDNILMDFSSGDIVHIDYNVCFDKGQRLKIPEIVPFRLTQTIEAALGLTGVEGTFRANCEAVVGVLRKNKDILLMLLEVFLWDPLVEWTRGDFHDDATIGGEERKGMELAVSLSLFASRVQEIRVPLQEHHDLLSATLPAVASALERFTDVLNQYELVSAHFFHVDQERSNLILHESSAKSIVAEATNKSEKTRASYEIQAREFAQAKAMVAEIAQLATTWMEQHGKILDALRSSSIPEIKACTKLSNTEDAWSLTSAVMVAGVPLTVVPEPTLAQSRDIDREVSQFIAELDHGLSCAVAALEAYSLSLQRILPLNYHTTSPVSGWAQVLQLSANTVSSDMLSIAKGQAAELIAKAHGGDLESIRCSHNDLCLKVERYAVEIKRVEEECAGLMNSIGLETESNSRDRLFSTFANYMQSMGFSRKADAASSIHSRPFKYDEPKGAKSQVEHEEKKERIWSNFNLAASSLYFNVRHRVLDILSNSSKEKHAECSLQTDFGTVFCEFEEQVEKCILIAGIVNEVSQLIGRDSANTDIFPVQYPSENNWASNIKSCLVSCQSLAGQLIGVVLPDIIRSVVSFNSEVMDAFGCLSQIRGSIDTALEQLIDVELERASLIELERNYFVKVALITEQQLALEEAAVKGRDHLSWEDAEELASQEEACKAQLDQLHQSWNQKDLRTSSLIKKEAGIRNALISAERHFKSLTNVEQDTEPHLLRRKVLLSRLIKPFSELESIDKVLPSFCSSTSSGSSGNLNLADLMISGYPMSGFIWKFSSLLNSYCFFIWQVGVVDSILDSCIHDVASFVDQNLGFDLLYNVVKKKLEIQLQEQIGLYLKERVAPALLDWLDKGNEHLKQLAEATKECNPDLVKKDDGAVKQVQHMIEECCNAHETVRAARSAASAMKKQVNELGEALCKTSLEIVQMEWMYDVALNTSQNTRVIFHKFLSSDDDLYPIIVNLSRPKLLEGVRSAISKIARSVECLQACERTSVTAEGQLERAMGWACGGPNPSASGNQSTKSSGIPPEFHDHLMRRRKMLCDARENASDIMKICMSLLEFEASRDGIFRIPGEIYQVRIGGDGRTWQQACLNALTRLEVTYHSFTRIEHEWKLAQNSMEAASSGLFSASNELSIASAKAKSASGDLQNILLAMRDCAYEVSVALTAFSRVTKVHTALTSECGSMLEEVLAITEGLHDVHSLGKEAAAAHHSLIEDLSKACSILLPLESVLSKDVAAMTDAMARERETKMEISPIHGQAIYQSYSLRIREACQAFTPLVSALTFSVEGLHSMLIRLARTASFHAGNLHKALEGLGESQYGGSPEINLLNTDLAGDAIDFDNKNEEFSNPIGADMEDLPGHMTESSQDKGWISPPDTIYSGSEYSIKSTESSLRDSFSGATEGREQISHVPNVRVKSSTVSGNSEPFSEAGSQEVSYCEDSESIHPEEVSNNDSGTPRTSPSDKSLAAGIETSHPLSEETSGVKLGFRDEASSSNQARVEDGNREAPVLNMDAGRRAARGKNAYAMSVLRRVKMKLDGRDIDNREVSIAEQVDHLLKQATSIDNLCNMYEGWTPWI